MSIAWYSHLLLFGIAQVLTMSTSTDKAESGSRIDGSTKIAVCMAYMIKWFRFNSFIGFTLTAFVWLFLCFQVLVKSGSHLDENNSFNLVENIQIAEVKEVFIYH